MPTDCGLKDRLFCSLIQALPQHLITRAAGALADNTSPALAQPLIKAFIRKYKVDMEEALHPSPSVYQSFNEFFTRPLKPDARDLTERPEQLICPADGELSAYGKICKGQVIQAKGINYSVLELLDNQRAMAARFEGGEFMTIYLSPKDYHRVHMPVAGKLKSMRYAPGKLLSVNQATARCSKGLFSRNERTICLFETEHGPMAMIMVGAIIVAGTDTVWQKQVCQPRKGWSRHWQYDDVELGQCAEMGRFNLGSTVVMLLPKGSLHWQAPETGSPLKLGQALAQLNPE